MGTIGDVGFKYPLTAGGQHVMMKLHCHQVFSDYNRFFTELIA
jgi:hypothetical protein